MVLAPDQLIHLGPDPVGSGWNHFDLGLGLSSHVNYPQAQLGNSPPQGQPWFYSRTNPTSGKDVVVFSAPLGGATTSTNTQYSRCELREYERNGTTKAAWDPKSGDHWIEGIYRVYGLSTLSKPSVCVQQAHDAEDDTIMVLTTLSGGSTQLVARLNGTQVAVLNSSYVEGTEFYLKTRVNNGTPEIYYTTNLASIPSTPTYSNSGFFSGAGTGWYYKTGSYNQTNESTDPDVDPDASIIRVEVRELKHWHSSTPAGGAWPTPATYGVAGGPTVDAGADASILPTGTFSRTAAVTLGAATLSSQKWEIQSGPFGVGNVLSTSAAVSWVPSEGTTTTGTTPRTAGVGGIPKPAPASNVELNNSNRGDMNITASGTASVPRIYDGGGFTCGRITISADYIIVQNYNIRPNSQYGVYITGSHVTVQNCDIKNISVSGDGDLNAITLLEGSDIDILYNTAINYVSGDPGGSHTDWIQTWVSSSHPTAVSNVRVIGNKATGPSNPSRDNSVPSIHQIIMVESAGRGGNSGGSGTPSNWTVLENEFGDSWGQSIKLDNGNNFVFARNKWVGSSDRVFALGGSGNVVYTSNTFGSGYGQVGASTTSGDGPANPFSGGTTTTTTPYPEGTYVLLYTAVTSAGTFTDPVTVIVTSTPGGPGGGGTPIGTYPTFVGAGTPVSSDGSNTVTVAGPSGLSGGMFQICIIQCSAAENVTAVPAGWQLLDDQTMTSTATGQEGADSSAWIFYNTTGDTQTRSWTKSGTRGFHAVRMAWKDWSALGQHLDRGSSYTTTPFATVVTPSTDKAIAITVLGSDRTDIGPQPVSVPSGWTQRYNSGLTVDVNEIETIAVADIQVDNRAAVGGNVPTGTGLGTSNYKLTNADSCSMFSFVLEGAISSGVVTPALVGLSVQSQLRINYVLPQYGPNSLFLTALPNLIARTTVLGGLPLWILPGLTINAVVFPRGAFIIIPTLTFTTRQVSFAALLLQIVGVLRAGALPYRRPVIRTDYRYPPEDHPFRLIAQRILDGEIVEWELPVGEDFQYTEQLSGPTVMQGSFRPEQISVQELDLDGYAYWLHVEIAQEIRASAILLPPQYVESAMSFSAEGVSAAPHYAIYDGLFSQIQVDPLSVVRSLWNYVQSLPNSDFGVVVSPTSSPVRIGKPPTTEITTTTEDDGTTTTNTRDIPAEPYELNWWDAKNIGEEIDSLSGATPFDYVERHMWNSDRTDVLHFIDLGYPRLGVARTTLLFNEENILEVVPIQEAEDTYASAVLVIGAGDGADTIRAYRATPYGDRIRKQVVVTDKSITSQEMASSRAEQELAFRRGRAFEVGELVISAYHPNAPIGSYRVGDDIQVQVEVPWLMLLHTAWYRITSIQNTPSSDKIRLGLARSSSLLDTSDVWTPPDDYVPFPPLPPVGAVGWVGNVQLVVRVTLVVIPPIPVPTAHVVLISPTTLTAGGVAFGGSFAFISFWTAQSLVVSEKVTTFPTTTLSVVSTLRPDGVATSFGFSTVTMISTSALSLGVVTYTVYSVELAAVPILLPSANVSTALTTTLNAAPSLTVGSTHGRFGAASLSAGTTLTADATVSTGTTITQLGKTTNGTGQTSSSGAKTVVSKATPGVNGTITAGHARMWVDSGTASVKMCVYSDSSGLPSSLLGLSDALTLSNTAEALQDFTFTGAQQASVTVGTDVWIGFTWADPGTNSIFWSRDTTASQAQTNSLNSAASFGTPGSALTGPIDAYVDVSSTTGGGGGGTTPVVRDSKAASGASSGSSAVVTKPAGLASGDLLIGIAVCDNDGTLGNLTGPSWGTPSSSAPAGSGNPGMKIWTKIATSIETAASSFTFSAGSGVYCSAAVIAIQTGTYNSSSPTTTPTFNPVTSSSTSHSAPSVTGVVDGLLITAHATDQAGVSSASYTPPSGMTELVDTAASNGFTALEVANLELTSTSATGTKTATCTANRPSLCASLIVNPA